MSVCVGREDVLSEKRGSFGGCGLVGFSFAIMWFNGRYVCDWSCELGSCI